MQFGMARTRVLAGVLLVMLGISGCTGRGEAPSDVLVALADAAPVELLAQGMLLRQGPAGHELLAERLGLDPRAVRGSAVTGPPSVRLLRIDGTFDAIAVDAALDEVPAPAGWRWFVRGGDARGLVGIPAIGVTEGLLVTGSLEELSAVAAGGAGVELPTEALEGATMALVQASPSPVAGPDQLTPARAVVLTDGEEEGGRLSLILAEPGDQDDAVALAVRVRTRGPLGPDGTPLLQAGAPLTTGSLVTLEVTWRVSPDGVLQGGLVTGLLDDLVAR